MLFCFLFIFFWGGGHNSTEKWLQNTGAIPHLLAIPLLGLLLVLPDNPFILGAQLWQNGAQFWPSGRVHLHVHFIPGDARPYLLKFLKSRQMLVFIDEKSFYQTFFFSSCFVSPKSVLFYFLPHQECCPKLFFKCKKKLGTCFSSCTTSCYFPVTSNHEDYF